MQIERAFPAVTSVGRGEGNDVRRHFRSAEPARDVPAQDARTPRASSTHPGFIIVPPSAGRSLAGDDEHVPVTVRHTSADEPTQADMSLRFSEAVEVDSGGDFVLAPGQAPNLAAIQAAGHNSRGGRRGHGPRR